MAKTITHIGKLTGKVLLFGGVYSNLQALEALKQVAEQEGIPPQNCISTGDLIGYCSQPEETIQLFKLWKARSISGNVETQLSNGAEDCGCDFKEGSRCEGFSQQWYPYAQSRLSKNSLHFLNDLPLHISFTFARKQCTVVNGSYFNISEFIFKSTSWADKQPNFEATNSDVIIGGHCGLPFYNQQNGKLWLNPGVIGMPANDGNPSVWYAILDDSNKTFNFKHRNLNYNYRLTNQLMQNEMLPQEYARTIITGIWDNTEILPPIESGLQGFGIKL